MIYNVDVDTSIQTAVDAVLAAGGGVVHLETGTHGDEDNFPITINNAGKNIVITGEGIATIIDTGGNYTVFSITNCAGCTIENLKIDAADLTTNTQAIISINETSDNRCVVRNVNIVGHTTNKRGRGVYILSENCFVNECTFDYCYSGVYGLNANESVVTNNKLGNCQVYAIYFENSPDCLIAQNHITDSAEGITVYLSSDRCVIIGNLCNNNTSTSMTKSCIISTCDYCVFIGNTICNNTINNASTSGALTIFSADYTLVSSNNISINTNSGAGDMYGIHIYADCNYTRLGSNIIQGNDINIYNLSTTTQTTGVPIGNTLAWGAHTAPTGYLICDGSAISRTTYSALFAVIGENFGDGDNVTTFQIPDFRGRFLRGRANGSSRDPDRASRTAMAGGGNSGDNVGSVQTDTYTSHYHNSAQPQNIGYNDMWGQDDLLSAAAMVYEPDNSCEDNEVASRTNSKGGNETRPENAYVNFIIKY